MKKLLLSVLLAASVAVAKADNFTLVMADQWGTTDADLTEWTQQGITFTPSVGQNPSQKVPVYKKKNKEVRFYALNTLTVSVPESGAPITSLAFTLSSQGMDEQAVITPSAGEMATQTVGNTTVSWTGSAHTVTFTVGATNELHNPGIVEGSGQFDFIKVDVATGSSTITKPQDTETTFYMCNATDNNGVLSSWTQGNLNFTASKGADETANDPALKNGEEARFYVGNTLTVKTVDGKNITSIQFLLSDQGLEQQAAVVPSTGAMKQAAGTNATWEGDASSVTFTVGANEYGTNATKKGQFDFTQINIAYNSDTMYINALVADDDAPAEYFTPTGLKVQQPASGIYIKRQGNKVTKVAL